MTGAQNFDVRGLGFNEFLDFLFARPVVPFPTEGGPAEGPWYWSSETLYNPGEVVENYIQLFHAPESLPQRFTDDQLNQGFWALCSPNLNCS